MSVRHSLEGKKLARMERATRGHPPYRSVIVKWVEGKPFEEIPIFTLKPFTDAEGRKRRKYEVTGTKLKRVKA